MAKYNTQKKEKDLMNVKEAITEFKRKINTEVRQ